MAMSSMSLLIPLFLGRALNILCPLAHFSGYKMAHLLPLSLLHYQSSGPQRTTVSSRVGREENAKALLKV